MIVTSHVQIIYYSIVRIVQIIYYWRKACSLLLSPLSIGSPPSRFLLPSYFIPTSFLLPTFFDQTTLLLPLNSYLDLLYIFRKRNSNTSVGMVVTVASSACISA